MDRPRDQKAIKVLASAAFHAINKKCRRDEHFLQWNADRDFVNDMIPHHPSGSMRCAYRAGLIAAKMRNVLSALGERIPRAENPFCPAPALSVPRPAKRRRYADAPCGNPFNRGAREWLRVAPAIRCIY